MADEDSREEAHQEYMRFATASVDIYRLKGEQRKRDAGAAMMDTREAVARALHAMDAPSLGPLEACVNWPAYIPQADAAIAAHLKALADAGFVVAPREPTEAMLDEAYLEIADKDGATRAYRAMIEACQAR